ncbi:MAG: 3-isopropylmalate dehydratase small subunit [Desulfotignum sp.]|nr:3-isopropylmalate dehydratase small subunit [Desulfotignum sp.]MCF8088412.1 3-isopropylmalate dehydratase small subunit [Desulfotignum sp.]MCF8137072.1 3-isopropylmalate dehydratase small subunit [Desulfotignum sp.]
MTTFSGTALCLDRADINTDEIIPARYLTEIDKNVLGPHLMEDLELAGFDPEKDLAGIGVLVTRENFGCGSSREHAPWALEANGIRVVIAESFARIFYQNMFNCGMLAVTLAPADIDRIFQAAGTASLHILADVDQGKITVTAGPETWTISFFLTGFEKALVQAGGWVEYADRNY